LRFQDELQSIKTILPSLRHRVVEVLKKIRSNTWKQEAMGSMPESNSRKR